MIGLRVNQCTATRGGAAASVLSSSRPAVSRLPVHRLPDEATLLPRLRERALTRLQASRRVTDRARGVTLSASAACALSHLGLAPPGPPPFLGQRLEPSGDDRVMNGEQLPELGTCQW